MKALYKGKSCEVWEVSKTGARPDWVIDAFARSIFVWADQRLRVKMALLKPSGLTNFETSLAGGVSGYVAGFGGLVLADNGDFIDLTNGKVLSPQTFAKHYQLLDEI